MKLPILFVFLTLMSVFASAQKKALDSLHTSYRLAKADTTKVDILLEMGNFYAQNQPDSELFKAQQALFISRRLNYAIGERRALKQMAEAYQYLGNFPMALQYYLQRLKFDEKQPDAEREVVTLLSIANLYQSDGDYQESLVYAKKGYSLIEKNKLESYRWYSYMVFGEGYEKMNQIANALYYDRKAFLLAQQQHNYGWLGMCLNNTGNALVKAKNYTRATYCYKSAIPYLRSNNFLSFLCESYQGLAEIFYRTGKTDSAIYYAKNSLSLAINRSFSQKYLRSCELLTSIYKSTGQPDSALSYHEKLLVMKDSIYSREKEKQIANLTIAEELRQKEIMQLKADQARHRTYVLNMLFVGLLIPFSFLISLVLSKRKMHAKVVEFSGIISLLLLFEYLTILLHPAIEKWTDDSPFLEILIFVAIAAILTPSHHRLERWMLQKLTAHHPHAHQNTEYATSKANSPNDEIKKPADS